MRKISPARRRSVAIVLAFALGLALVVYGVGCYSRPAGCIVAGLFLAGGAALVNDATTRKGA